MTRPILLTPEQRAAAPRCVYCGRPLKLSTWTIDVTPDAPAPAIGDTLTPPYCATTITVAAVSRTWLEAGRTRIEVWDGTYDTRYGAFERQSCGLAFGNAAARAGYRMTRSA